MTESTPDPVSQYLNDEGVPPAPSDETMWDTPEMQKVKQMGESRGVPAMAMLALTLAMLTSEIHPRVCIASVGKGLGNLNLFVSPVSRSGGGKTTGIGAARDLLGRHEATLIQPSSGEGILESYRKRIPVRVGVPDPKDPSKVKWEVQKRPVWLSRSCFMKWDEVGTMGSIAERRGQTLMPVLNTAWSGDDLLTTTVNEDSNRHVPAGEYRLSGVVGTQPGASGLLVGPKALNGTTQRFIFAKATFPDDYDYPDPLPADPTPLTFPDLSQIPAMWVNRDEDNDDGAEVLVGFEEYGIEDKPEPKILIDLTEEIASEIRRRIQASQRDSAPDPLDGHRAYAQLKVAAALALLHDRRYIVNSDWRRAEAVMMHSDETRELLEADAHKSVIEGAKSAGRMSAIQQEAADASKTYNLAKRLAKGVATHASRRAPDGDIPCEEGCKSQCLRDNTGRNYRAYRQEAIELALKFEWLIESLVPADGRKNHSGVRYTKGPKRP